MEDNKDILRQKFDEAKNLGMLVNLTRNKMNGIKQKLEQLQISRAMNRMDRMKGDNVEDEEMKIVDEEENMLRHSVEKEKEMYRKYYLALKNIKVEIEHMKAMLKKNRKQIQLDFEYWWKQQEREKKMKDKQDSKHKKAKIITGDKVADENIAEFYKMREEILKSMK